MAVSEASAIFNLAVKGVSVIADLRVGLYKGKVELDALEGLLLFLKAQHGLWSEQLPGYGLSEDKHLQPLVLEAEKALGKIKTEAEKLQKSSLRRFKKKLLYREIIYFQEKITQIVNAGPKLLADHVDRNYVLQKLRQQTPPPLDFGPDRKYVPIADSVLAVRKAVENGDGSQVVTLYGGPGMGKTSLVKHLAILYKDDQKKRGMAATFPHGVYYLDCRKDAGVLQLLQELLGNLGFGAVSGTQNDSATTGTGVQQEDYSALRANRITLRSRLAEQKLLIILDNVWEPEVLDELIVFAKGVKYLVTSQKRNIYSPIDGTAIEISMPNLEQSCQIMANHTAGLPEEGKLPDNIKGVVRDIICKLKYHPLAVADIGMSLDRDRAINVEEWNRVSKHVLDCLSHENDLDRPHAFGSRYNLSVSASMTQVVASLPQQSERQLLFLVTGLNGGDVLHDGDLRHGGDVPEPILEFFYSFIEPNLSLAKRNTRCLVDKSLIHKSERGNRSTLSIHPLRRYYILQRNLPDVRSTVSQIFVSSGDQDVAQLVKRADREDSAVVFGLGAMYFDTSLLDVLAGAVITRGLNMEIDALDLVNNGRGRKHGFKSLVRLLNVDHDAESWKRQANKSVKKIISKFFCQGKLDDDSMASLLEVPQTTSAACVALVALYYCHSQDFYARDIMFSEAYHETMQSLLRLFRDNAISMDRRRVVLTVLLNILDYESDDTILSFAAEYVKLFAMDNNFRDAGTHAFASASRRSIGRGIRTEFSGILETLFAVLGNGNAIEVQRNAVGVIRDLCEYRHFALKVAVLPDALKTLFHCYLSEDWSRLSVGPGQKWGALFFLRGPLNETAGDVLCLLSIVPENRVKLGAIEGIWDGLGDILTKLEEAWCSTTGEKLTQLKEHACQAAFILGYLGLERDLREAIVSIPGIREGLLFLQHIEISGYFDYLSNDECTYIYLHSSTRALTILYSEELGDPRAIDLPPVGDELKVFSRDSCDEGNASITSRTDNCLNYLGLYWTRVLAYREMGSYAEALKILEVDLIQKLDRQGYCVIQDRGLQSDGPWHSATINVIGVLMDCKIFLQAMVGDYAGALRCANRGLTGDIEWHYRQKALIQRGVVKRLCGELQEALDDFNAVIVEETWFYDSVPRSALWQRGYVKYLMGDRRGAAADAELAQQERHNILIFHRKTTFWDPPWWLSKIPISYLGFSM